MGHIDRIDLLVEDGEFPFWGGGFGISDRHRPGPKLLLAPHECDLSLAEVKHDARRMSGLPQGQLNRFSSKAWSNRPANSAGINNHFMRRTRPTGLNVFIAARKTAAAALELNSSESLWSHG